MTSGFEWQTTQRRYFWTVQNPGRHPKIDGPMFPILDRRYSFSLEHDSDDFYYVYVLDQSRETVVPPRPFETEVSIRDDDEEDCLTQIRNDRDKRPNIWRSVGHQIRAEVGEDFEETSLTFKILLTSYSEDLRPKPKTKHRSVQTQNYPKTKSAKSAQTPTCWKTDACLENLAQDFGRLLDRQAGSLPDVEFKCGDVSLRAHGSVLAARSEFFSKMLRTEWGTGPVEVQGMEADDFREFVRYLYSGTLPELTEEKAKAFYEAGNKYAVRGLARRCGDFLCENLTRENVLEYLVLADSHSHQDFKERAMDYILDKKIPHQDEHWLPFVKGHSKLAAEVLQRGFKLYFPK